MIDSKSTNQNASSAGGRSQNLRLAEDGFSGRRFFLSVLPPLPVALSLAPDRFSHASKMTPAISAIKTPINRLQAGHSSCVSAQFKVQRRHRSIAAGDTFNIEVYRFNKVATKNCNRVLQNCGRKTVVHREISESESSCRLNLTACTIRLYARLKIQTADARHHRIKARKIRQEKLYSRGK